MVLAKRIWIESESRETFIVRVSGNSGLPGFCEACSAEVEMLTLDDAVRYTGRSIWELIPQIESGAVHSIEVASRHLLICKNSLERVFKQT